MLKDYKSEKEVNDAVRNKRERQDKVNDIMRAKLTGQELEDFKNGEKFLSDDPAGLKTAFQKLCPNATEKELDIMTNPEKYKVDKTDEWIK